MQNYVIYALIGIGVLILIVCLAIASTAGANMMEKFEEINKKLSSSFTVAHVFAAMISRQYLDGRVKVGQKAGYLTDAYMSGRKAVFLSEKVFDNSSVAALAIAAHELGHALQDKDNPQTLRRRDRLGLIAKLLGYMMTPLFIGGIVLFFAVPSNLLYSIVCLGGAIGIFFLALVVKGLTISIEKDASAKALIFLKEMNILDDDELKLAKTLLNAALLTYIADFLRAILGWTMLTPKTKLFE